MMHSRFLLISLMALFGLAGCRHQCVFYRPYNLERVRLTGVEQPQTRDGVTVSARCLNDAEIGRYFGYQATLLKHKKIVPIQIKVTNDKPAGQRVDLLPDNLDIPILKKQEIFPEGLFPRNDRKKKILEENDAFLSLISDIQEENAEMQVKVRTGTTETFIVFVYEEDLPHSFDMTILKPRARKKSPDREIPFHILVQK